MLSLLLAAAVSAGPTVHQDWIVTSPDADTFGAATQNDSGAVLAEVCTPSTDSCVWVVLLDQWCEPGAQYSTLANTDSASYVLNLICDKQIDGKWRYAFMEFDDVTKAASSGDRIGFAIALRGGMFQVTRFSLKGVNEARRDMLDRTIAAQKNSTRDITL